MENNKNNAEKSSTREYSRHEFFLEYFLNELESLSVSLDMFTEKPDILELKKEIETTSKNNYLIYEAKEILAFSMESEFFHHYHNDKTGSSNKVRELFDWLSERAKEILNSNFIVDEETLSELLGKIILYSYLSNKPKAKQTKSSFQWNGSSGELSELYQRMITINLIEKNTSEADFKAIFEAKPLDKVKPIIWQEKPVLLAYFINRLMDLNKVLNRDRNKRWKIAESSFVPASNLKQSADNYQDNKSGLPKNHHLIDELF